MRTIIVLLIIVIVSSRSEGQEKVIITSYTDQHNRISKIDSLWLGGLNAKIKELDSITLSSIPQLLDNCEISNSTKVGLIWLLFPEDGIIPKEYFPVLSKILFYFDYRLGGIFLPYPMDWHRFTVLERLVEMKNAVNFCNYVFDNNILDRCSLVHFKCGLPPSELNYLREQLIFCAFFADLYRGQDLSKIEQILSTTNSWCLYNNVNSIKLLIDNPENRPYIMRPDYRN